MEQNTKALIAITGGIGSGKSTIAKMVQIMGHPVFYADIEAKKIIDSEPETKSQLISLFGKDIYDTNGKLNRQELAKIIFNNNNAKEKVNAIVHPAVWDKFCKWSKGFKCNAVFMESAILHECGWADRFDKIICVTANLETRIKRTMERDNCNREQVVARIKNQLSDEEKISKSHYVIYTNDNCSELEQLLKTLEKIL